MPPVPATLPAKHPASIWTSVLADLQCLADQTDYSTAAGRTEAKKLAVSAISRLGNIPKTMSQSDVRSLVLDCKVG
jgi:hypothetical protein